MTTAEFRSAVAHPASQTVAIAGVPWPAYKLLALVLGVLVFGAVAVSSVGAGDALLTGTTVATLIWLGFGLRHTGA